MTEFATPREALEYYQTVRPDSIMGYRPYVECAVSLQLITSGALEWRAIEGVKYGKLTDRGLFMLEQLYHMDTQAQLDAAHKRIAELEAVCREVVEALEIRHDSNLIRLDFGADNYARVYMPALNVLRRLLDTLPPSE